MNEKLEKNENKKTADVLRAENRSVIMCSMEKMVKRRKRSTS